jgi:hypothetical protein
LRQSNSFMYNITRLNKKWSSTLNRWTIAPVRAGCQYHFSLMYVCRRTDTGFSRRTVGQSPHPKRAACQLALFLSMLGMAVPTNLGWSRNNDVTRLTSSTNQWFFFGSGTIEAKTIHNRGNRLMGMCVNMTTDIRFPCLRINTRLPSPFMLLAT